VPGLLIPLWDVYGELRAYQLRPDEPRVKGGRAVKYETPHGLRMMLDCPPATLEHVRNPKVRLWITEGVRKADALASVGLRAIALLGVECWRGTNEHGGKTSLEDWYGVALDGRELVIAFDSDAFQKPAVHAAVERLGRWLESRGAHLGFVYLPHAADGSKLGVDDFLAEHSRDELLDRIEEIWRPLPHTTVKTEAPAPDVPLRPTAELLRVVGEVLNRYVILPSAAARLALALYVLHTWAFDAAHCTPYLVIRSATKRSGKTRLEEVIALLVRCPWRIAAASESAMFRKIHAERPTLLLDEVDALFGRGVEGTEPVRAILNAGNRPGASVARVVGEGSNLQTVDFCVYCPKVLAGIVTPRWPDTVLDRSIVIDLQRKKRGESVARFRVRKVEADTEWLRAALGRWAAEHVEVLREAEPELPAALDDRAAESWEPLLAVADLGEAQGGERWGEAARKAARSLATGRVEDDAHGVLALKALKTIFGDLPELSTATITEKLNADDQLPFGEYRKGAGLNGRGLAKLLRPFAISPENVGPKGARAKGYRRAQFVEAWARYCESPAEGASDPFTRALPSNDGGFGDSPIRSPDPRCTDSEMPESPVDTGGCTGERIETPPEGAETPNAANGGPRRRTLADLADEALLVIFPGASIETGSELESDIGPCPCRQRTREWRLTGGALDMTTAYVSKSDRSGWRAIGRGHPWQCALCHTPAAGLDVEWRECP
jgi:hypothetical protein